jgi:hypothetical protein
VLGVLGLVRRPAPFHAHRPRLVGVKVGALCAAGYGGIELGLALAGETVDLRWIAEFDDHLTRQ